MFDRPSDGRIEVPLAGGSVSGAYLLSDPSREPLAVRAAGGGIEASGPTDAPDATDTVVVFTTG